MPAGTGGYTQPPAALQGPARMARLFEALGDPWRLEIVLQLYRQGECTCNELNCGRPKSTMSHHFRVLREAGLVHTRIEGVTHVNRLCREELERDFPGLLETILRAAPKP